MPLVPPQAARRRVKVLSYALFRGSHLRGSEGRSPRVRPSYDMRDGDRAFATSTIDATDATDATDETASVFCVTDARKVCF